MSEVAKQVVRKGPMYDIHRLEEAKETVSETVKRRWEDPEYRKNHSDKMKDYWDKKGRRTKGSKCELCGYEPKCKAILDVHHIVPRSMGGRDIASNRITLCPTCHREVHFGVRSL